MRSLLLPKPVPRILTHEAEKRAKEKHARLVMAEVRKRDGSRCRVCGQAGRLHFHHLWYRSLGGRDTTSNIFMACAKCHQLLHAHWIDVFGSNANARLVFKQQQLRKDHHESQAESGGSGRPVF